MAEQFVRAVSVLYQETEYALIDRTRRELAADMQAPNWVEQKLAAVRDLVTGARRILDRLDERAVPGIRQSVADAYTLGQRAAVDEVGALTVGSDAYVREHLPNAAALDRLALAVVDDTRAAHLGILRQTIDMFRAVIATVSGRTLAGVEDRRATAQAAFDRLVNRGITGFVDKGGRSWQLSSYVEMAVRSAVGRAAVQGHTDSLRAAGLDLVMVSDAPQECRLCRPWEGKVLSLDDVVGAGPVEVEHATVDGQMVTVQVAATLDEARAVGFMHPNCRHSLSAYLPGVTVLPTDTEDPVGDENRQRLRHLERQVRKWKRREAAGLDEGARKAARAKVRAWQSAIRDHVDATGLIRQRHREQLMQVTPPPGERPSPKRKTPPRPPAPVTPAGPAPARAEVSAQTRAVLDEVRAQLPAGREGWTDARSEVVRPAMRRIDAHVLAEKARLAELREQRQKIVEEAEAEFTAKRTRRSRRPEILAERTRQIDSDILLSEYGLAERERQAALPSDELERQRPLLAQIEPEERRFTYRRDERGALLPPEQYERHLTAVLRAGRALHEDMQRALDSDPEVVRLREEQTRLAADLKGKDNPSPAEVDRAWQVYRDRVRREADVARALLAEVRPMNGTVDAVLDDPANHTVPGNELTAPPAQWRQMLDEAVRHFPEAWHEQVSAAGNRLHVVGSERAFYRAGNGRDVDLFALDEVGGSAYRGAFTSYAAEVATHEMGHRMEQYIPGLRELEYTYVRRRSTGFGGLEEPRRLSDLYPNSAYAAHEVAYPDDWRDAYTGKTYEQWAPDDPACMSSEAFQVGLQDLFGRSARQFGDVGLTEFTLAVLALL
ncbi:phage minor capsid protein [Streptomyces syringium]|uniref:phage minor capsid protein n=1 Tax=Streptomyces syringium TaxID=76729 RepID=UPI00364F3817